MNSSLLDKRTAERPQDQLSQVLAPATPPIAQSFGVNLLLRTALAYAAIGWYVLVAWWVDGGVCACPQGSRCRRPGKHPLGDLVPNGLRDATRDPGVIEMWWTRFPLASPAIALTPSGLIAFDIDGEKGDFEKLAELEARLGPLPDTVRQRSGSGVGEHRMFRAPGFAIRGVLDGITMRGENYLIVEPAGHVTGGRYEFLDGHSPAEIAVAELPVAWREALRRPEPGPSALRADVEIRLDGQPSLANADDLDEHVKLPQLTEYRRAKDHLRRGAKPGRRSEAVFAVVNALVVAGATDPVIAAVLLTDLTDADVPQEYALSAHVLEQGDVDRYVRRQIKRARGREVSGVGRPIASSAWEYLGDRAVPLRMSELVRADLDLRPSIDDDLASTFNLTTRAEQLASFCSAWAASTDEGKVLTAIKRRDRLGFIIHALQVEDGESLDGAVAAVVESLAAAAPPIVIDSVAPLRLAEEFIRHCALDDGGRLTVRRWADQFYRYADGAFSVLTEEQVAAELYALLDRMLLRVRDKDGDWRLTPVVPRTNLINEVRKALPSRGLIVEEQPPTWLDNYPNGPSPLDVMVVKNGILDLRNRRFLPATPQFFCTASSPVVFDPYAPRPALWLQFLDQLWPGDPEAIATLQMWFGYLLTPDTRLQKILLMVGPKRSGKGTIARILRELLGHANVVGPTLSSMQGEFGLWPLLGKPLAIISDARLSGRSDQAVIAERLLSISGEDATCVNRKQLPQITVSLPTRVMILTNELPRLSDASGALASRFIVLRLTESFYGREDHGLTDRLLRELPGILNWAIEGWQMLATQGYLPQPASANEDVQDLNDLSSPVAAFVREMCEVGVGYRVDAGTLYQKWCEWCAHTGRTHGAGNSSTFGRDLRAAVSSINVVRPRRGNGRQRVYEGIRVLPSAMRP